MARKLHKAIFSPCRTWRYTLRREVDTDSVRLVAFIGLNPSTADETNDDPTIRRCMGFARDWGFGTLVMLNAYALRSTDPKGLWLVDDPVGPQNDLYIAGTCKVASLVVCAWGVNIAQEREDSLWNRFGDKLYCLGVTKGGHPRHPLYVKADTRPVKWNG